MYVLMLLAIFLCTVVTLWLWMKQRASEPPEFPGALPIFGHSFQVIGDQKHLLNFFYRAQDYSLAKGGVIKLWFGTHSFYMITDPEDSLTVANTCFSKPYIYDFAKEYVNNGLVSAEASIWKTHRKLLNPAFNQQVLNTFLNEMNVQSRKLATQLASKVDKGPFDVRRILLSYTVSTVTKTSLGLNTQDQNLIETDYAEAIEDLFDSYCDRVQKVWFHLSYLFNWSAMKRKQTMLIEKLKNFIDPVILKRKAELKTNKYMNMSSDSSRGKFKPIIDQMLHMSEEHDAFTDEDIRNHLDTLVIAAYDTTSSVLTIVLLILGSQPDVQERIFNELQEVFENNDDDITKEHLRKLVYLEAVIKESMRVYPVIPIVGRKVDKDVKLKNYTLRAGNTCLIGLYGLLRHPMWGADAEQFRPERWLNPAALPENPNLYATFSIGRRNCIGKQYAMMTMKTALAHILRRFRVSGEINNLICKFEITVKPVSGHLISLAVRT